MTKKPHRTKTKTTAAPALAPDLDLEQAAQTTIEWWDEHAMLADLDPAQLLADHDQVITVAHGLQITTVRGLHEQAAEVLMTASGTTRLAQFTTPDDSDSLHRLRNALSAVILSTEVRHSVDPRPYDLIADLPAIAPRPGGKRRPLTDDEVLLTRSGAIYSMSRGGRYVLSSMQYALAESGARPMETTDITPRDFDNPRQPTTVTLPGVHERTQRRTVSLGHWAARLLTRGLDRHLGLNSRSADLPICFAGRSGTKSASASSSNNLKHCLERVGITAPSLEGSAITRWRVAHDLGQHGEVAALKMLGQFDPLHIKIHRVYEYIDRATPTVTITPVPAARRSFKGL